MNRQAFDKAAEILKTRPNHFYSLSAIERLVYTLPPPPKPADLDTAERVSKYLLDNLDTVFAASNKPMDVKDADWATYKPAMQKAAQATLAWVYVQRKDHPKAETELTKYLHMDPTQASTSLIARRRTPGAESGSSRQNAAGVIPVRARRQPMKARTAFPPRRASRLWIT